MGGHRPRYRASVEDLKMIKKVEKKIEDGNQTEQNKQIIGVWFLKLPYASLGIFRLERQCLYIQADSAFIKWIRSQSLKRELPKFNMHKTLANHIQRKV